ncbi:hypothetical protein NPIL_376621 [Nephila pilipes]|uniref:Uncharacterized protein n=1 Tax=Nephila pilipes TaxID=299642 RepID=A0A8X6MIU8_NEPPI|nr:hypothetical protein NPIL_376621 [Nephila pilipes]
MDNLVKKRSSGQRPKKKRFQGNKYMKKSKSEFGRIVFEDIAPNKSTSAKKLPCAHSVSQSLEKDFSKLIYFFIGLTIGFESRVQQWNSNPVKKRWNSNPVQALES